MVVGWYLVEDLDEVVEFPVEVTADGDLLGGNGGRLADVRKDAKNLSHLVQ